MFEKALNDVLRYVQWDKSDWHPALTDPADLNKQLVYADWLDDHNESDLAGRIRREVQAEMLAQANPHLKGLQARPKRLDDDASTKDFVLHAVKTGHPNPTVRAHAKKLADSTAYGDAAKGESDDLVSLLLHSDPTQNPHDHDVAVYLSPEDASSTHTAQHTLKAINDDSIEHGLEAKVVRGTAYLLDHEHPVHAAVGGHKSYGAPAIVFTAPVNDHSELKLLRDHAERLATERAGLEGAHMGPVH